LDGLTTTTPDNAFDRLRQAGWSVGEVCLGSIWLVSGHNGEHPIRVDGAGQVPARLWP
jgi:hypothetical protein